MGKESLKRIAQCVICGKWKAAEIMDDLEALDPNVRLMTDQSIKIIRVCGECHEAMYKEAKLKGWKEPHDKKV